MKNYNVSTQLCIPSFRLGFAFLMIMVMCSLKQDMQYAMSLVLLSKMIALLCFHMLQHPAIMHSFKPISLVLFLASIIMSLIFRSVFHSRPKFIQIFWLKSQLKKRCWRYSLGSSSHSTQLLSSMKKYFLINRSLVLSLSSSNNQKKNFCFDRQHDFQIH